MLKNKEIIVVVLFLFIESIGIALMECNNSFFTFYEKEKESEGIFIIEKIKLKKRLYAKDSILNNVEKNIEVIIKEEKLLVLASHSGSGQHAYFNYLIELDKDDLILVTYEQEIQYKIAYVYEEKKDGNLSLYYNKLKNTLILITCCKVHQDRQLIFVCYQV